MPPPIYKPLASMKYQHWVAMSEASGRRAQSAGLPVVDQAVQAFFNASDHAAGKTSQADSVARMHAVFRAIRLWEDAKYVRLTAGTSPVSKRYPGLYLMKIWIFALIEQGMGVGASRPDLRPEALLAQVGWGLILPQFVSETGVPANWIYNYDQTARANFANLDPVAIVQMANNAKTVSWRIESRPDWPHRRPGQI
jgi:hypothetical protein